MAFIVGMIIVTQQGFAKGDPVRLLAPYASDCKRVRGPGRSEPMRLWVKEQRQVPLHAQPRGHSHQDVREHRVRWFLSDEGRGLLRQ